MQYEKKAPRADSAEHFTEWRRGVRRPMDRNPRAEVPTRPIAEDFE